MTTRHLVDREIAPIIDLFPVDFSSIRRADHESARKAAETYAILPPPVTPEEIAVPSDLVIAEIRCFCPHYGGQSARRYPPSAAA